MKDGFLNIPLRVLIISSFMLEPYAVKVALGSEEEKRHERQDQINKERKEEFDKRFGNVFSFYWYLFEDLWKSIPFIGLPVLNLIKKFRYPIYLGVFIWVYPYLRDICLLTNFLLIRPFLYHLNWVYTSIFSSVSAIKETVNPPKDMLSSFLEFPSSNYKVFKCRVSKFVRLIDTKLISLKTLISVVKYSFVLFMLSLVIFLLAQGKI